MTLNNSPTLQAVAVGSLMTLCGCAGLIELQGAVNTSPSRGSWKQGGSLAGHIGFSSDTSSSFVGIGGTGKVDVSEDYGVIEQGIHVFYLNEQRQDLALYGRAGGLVGVNPVSFGQVSLSVFLQGGAMFCLDLESQHCVSLGAQAQYIALFRDTLLDDPWVGVTLGYGQWWHQ